MCNKKCEEDREGGREGGKSADVEAMFVRQQNTKKYKRERQEERTF